jgi:hypothetical protein
MLLSRLSLLVIALTACSSASAPAGFPAQPIQTLSSKMQQLSVAVRTSPQPPTRGDQNIEYSITDRSTGKPLAGLTLGVVPWMPVMGHGASIVPSVTETAPGTYLIANVDLFMAGEWVLRTMISGRVGDAGGDAGIVNDYVEPAFDIP